MNKAIIFMLASVVILGGFAVQPAQAGGSAVCVTARVDTPFHLPDGQLYPANTLTLCDGGAYSPVDNFHRILVGGVRLGRDPPADAIVCRGEVTCPPRPSLSAGTTRMSTASPASPHSFAHSFNPHDGESLRDPHEMFARMRREQPVFFSPQLGMWIVSRHSDICSVLRDPARFSSHAAFSRRARWRRRAAVRRRRSRWRVRWRR